MLRTGASCSDNHELRLLGRLLHYFQADGIELQTRSESPVGAGIAGSSALNIAVCGALVAWSGRARSDAEIMQIAMNVEAQAIDVPTGVQDYRPALYGGISAVELAVDGVRRVPLPVAPADLRTRLVLAYTGASRNSGINNWEVTKRHIDGDRDVQQRFARIRDIAVAMRGALERGDWAEVGRQIAEEWENRKGLAPGVTTPEIDAILGAATKAGAIGGKVCGAGGGGCLFCLGEPADVPAIRQAIAGARRQLLDFTIESEACASRAAIDGLRSSAVSLDNLAIARVLAEIGDLLEIKSENPFKIRAYRNASETIAHTAERLADLTAAQRLAIPGIGKDLAAKISELVETGTIAYHQGLLEGVSPDHSRSAPPARCRTENRCACSTASSGSARSTISERAAREGRLRNLKGMGAKKEAFILKALEERARSTGRRLMAESHETADALLAALRAHAPDARHLRRRQPPARLRDHAATSISSPRGAPPSLMDAFTGYKLVERVLAHGETKSSVLLLGRISGRPARSCRARAWAPRCSTSPDRRRTTSRSATARIQRGFKLNEYGLFRIDDGQLVAGGDGRRDLSGAGPAPSFPPELRENRGEIEAAEHRHAARHS